MACRQLAYLICPNKPQQVASIIGNPYFISHAVYNAYTSSRSVTNCAASSQVPDRTLSSPSSPVPFGVPFSSCHAPGLPSHKSKLTSMSRSIGLRAMSSSTAAMPKTQNLSWVFSSPFWRTVVGIPLVALNAAIALPMYLRGPQSFFKAVDRSKTVFPPIMVGLESQLVEVGGLKLHVMATDAEEGKPLMLFLHGFPEFWYSWRYQLKHFRSKYRVAALDMRGYNLSDKPEGVENYTTDKLAHDVSQVVKALGHNSCILVGHDWGAVVAWTTAALFPESVERVICLSAPPFGQLVHNMGVKQALTSYYMLIATFYPKIMEVLIAAHDFDFLRVMITQEVGADRITTEDIERYKQALQRPGALKAALSYYTALWSITAQDQSNPVNRRALEEPVRQPALFLIGEDEAFITPELLDGMEKVVPKLTREAIPNAGHFLAYQRPEAVNTAIENWLAASGAPQ